MNTIRPNKRRGFHLQEVVIAEEPFIDEDDLGVSFEINLHTISVLDPVIEEPTEETSRDKKEEEDTSVPIKRRRIMTQRELVEDDEGDDDEIMGDTLPVSATFYEEPIEIFSNPFGEGRSRLGIFLDDFNNIFTDFNRMSRNMRQYHERMNRDFERMFDSFGEHQQHGSSSRLRNIPISEERDGRARDDQ